VRRQGFATYIALTLLVFLIGLVFIATVAGSYAANVVSSALGRSREAKVLAQIHNADALRSLVYLDYRITSLDSQTVPGPARLPGGRDALTHLCQNKPPYLAYSWFYEPGMRPPSAQGGISDCPLLLVNDYVGQALSTPPPPVMRSTYSIYHSTTALITAVAPHLSNWGPPLLEYAFTPVLVKSVWSSPDPHYLLPFSPLYTPALSQGSIIDAPGILGLPRSREFGAFADNVGSDTTEVPATFIAPIGMPNTQPPTPPSTLANSNCARSGSSFVPCDPLGYAYNSVSPAFSFHLPYFYWMIRFGAIGHPHYQVLLPPHIYFGLDQVSFANSSAIRNPFVGGFSYFTAPLQTNYSSALRNAISRTYETLSPDRSFLTGLTTVQLGVDENDNLVVRVGNSYERRFPPDGEYTTLVLDFSNGSGPIRIQRLPGSAFAMNGRVNLDLVILAGNREIELLDDLTMKHGSCDSVPTWRQGVPIPAYCPRKQLMLLHLVTSSSIYLSAVKNWVLNGVVIVGADGFAYRPYVVPTGIRPDIYMIGAWFGGYAIMPSNTSPFSSHPLPRLFFTAPELGRSQRIWPKFPYPLHINALQVLGSNLFSE